MKILLITILLLTSLAVDEKEINYCELTDKNKEEVEFTCNKNKDDKIYVSLKDWKDSEKAKVGEYFVLTIKKEGFRIERYKPLSTDYKRIPLQVDDKP